MEVEVKEAALDPLDAFVSEALDQAEDQTIKVDETTDSAPVKDAIEASEDDGIKPKSDKLQDRFDKLTADKYAEKRRADDLQRKIDALESAKPKETLTKPKLEDHDYDEEAFNKANRDYDVEQGVQDALAEQEQNAKAERQKAEAEKTLSTFNERASKMGKADFEEKLNAIPILPDGAVDAIMQTENGAEVAYYLGSNLEKADALANMPSSLAIMELGRLSAQLSTKPEIKPSAAPEPIDPLKSGSALSSDIGDEMSMSDWMAKYG